MSTHKQAAVLRAIADGRAVEWQSKADGSWSGPNGVINPITDHHLSWRVKEDEADLFWDNEDIHILAYDGIADFMQEKKDEGAVNGEEFIIARAKRLPDLRVQLIVQPNGEIDWYAL